MRFIISAIFASALLGAIASADPKRGQQSTFRLERRHEHHHHYKVNHSHHRKDSQSQGQSFDDQGAAIVRSNAYDPVAEDAPVAPLVPDFIATTETNNVAETMVTNPRVGDLVIFDENGKPIGAQRNPDQVVAEDAGEHHHRASHHHHQQKHHKKAHHRGKHLSHHKRSLSKKHSKRAIVKKQDRP